MDSNIEPVVIKGKKYVSIKEFGEIVSRSYTTIYMLARYGFRDGSEPLENIEWNSRILILLSEKDRIKEINPVGRPKKEKV